MADKLAEVAAEVEVQEQVLVDLSAELDDWRKANADALVEIPRDIREECGERGARVVEELGETFDIFNAANRTEAWVLGRHKPPAHVGSKVVNEAERAVREQLKPPRDVYVRQAEHLKLRAGKDAVDIGGNVLKFAEMDAGVRDGSIRLRIAHGQPRSVRELCVQYD